ncbi:MAG: hypothetical protein L0228_15120 [Planctomycetes bacterium]|nr:hypothetical protein [Planctomycetota bacterium]
MNRFALSVVVSLAVGHSILASEDTIGPNGINSAATGLTGFGGFIGQVEGFRPGKPGHDTAADCCNADVNPFLVYARDHEADVNEGLGDEHALHVASVMISSQDTIGMPGGVSAPLGVAPEAALTSSAYILPDIVSLHQDAALAAQAIAPVVLATNMSFGVPDEDGSPLDGTSTLSSFIDWSTRFQEVLSVVSGYKSNSFSWLGSEDSGNG